MTTLSNSQRERHIDTLLRIMNADPSILAEALHRQCALQTGEPTITQAALGSYDAVNTAKNLQHSWRRDLLAKFAAGVVAEPGPYSFSLTTQSRYVLTQRSLGEVIGDAALAELLARLRRSMVTYLHLRRSPFGTRRPK